jgi:hypothetical protein
MDLQEFVTSTLVQIVDGVAAARDQIAAGTTGASVNTHSLKSSDSLRVVPAQPVEFDVAVTVSTEAAAGTKGGIRVAVFNLSAEAGGKATSEAVSRIKFAVQLSQPGHFLEPRLERTAPMARGSWQD